MSDVIDQAVNDRERPLRDDLVIPFRTGYVRLRVEESARIVRNARRRFRRHNSGRKFVENEVWSALAATFHDPEIGPRDIKDTLRRHARDPRGTRPDVAAAHPGAAAARPVRVEGVCSSSPPAACSTRREALALYRPRSESVDDVRWTPADVALLDDARDVLGPKPGRNGKLDDADEIRTFGHIVIDEVQDLTPMQLKMATRRSLNGAMTIVGDLAQATGPLAPTDWDDVLDHLPDRKPSRVIGLVGRLPDPRPDHGARQQGDGRRHTDAAGPAVRSHRRCRARGRARRR